MRNIENIPSKGHKRKRNAYSFKLQPCVCGCKSTLRAKHQTQNIWVFDQQCWIRYRADDQKNRPARHDFLFRFLNSPPGMRIAYREWVVVRNLNLVHRSLFDTLLKGTFFEMVVFWSYDTALLCGENFDISGAFFVIGCCILFTILSTMQRWNAAQI